MNRTYLSCFLRYQIDSDGYLWVMANSIPKLIYSTIDVNEYNFRIWREKVEDAVKGAV